MGKKTKIKKGVGKADGLLQATATATAGKA